MVLVETLVQHRPHLAIQPIYGALLKQIDLLRVLFHQFPARKLYILVDVHRATGPVLSLMARILVLA